MIVLVKIKKKETYSEKQDTIIWSSRVSNIPKGQTTIWFIWSIKTKRRRSDPILWQKPLHQQKCQKGKVTTQTTRTFLLQALTNWDEILHMTLFWCTTDQVRVSSLCVNFWRSYASLWTQNIGNVQFFRTFPLYALTYWADQWSSEYGS